MPRHGCRRRSSGAAPRSKLARGPLRRSSGSNGGRRVGRVRRVRRVLPRATRHARRQIRRLVACLRSGRVLAGRGGPRRGKTLPGGRRPLGDVRSFRGRGARGVSLRRVVSATRLGRALGAVRTRRRGGHLGRAARVRWVSERACRLARLGATEKRSQTRVLKKSAQLCPTAKAAQVPSPKKSPISSIPSS